MRYLCMYNVYVYVVYVAVYFWVYPGSCHAGDVHNILSYRRANVTIACYYATCACAARGKAIGMSACRLSPLSA